MGWYLEWPPLRTVMCGRCGGTAVALEFAGREAALA